MKTFLERAKDSGGIFPTLFNFPKMWKLNASRCGGRFNLFFFWMYPVAAAMLLPFTVLCLIEVLLTPND